MYFADVENVNWQLLKFYPITYSYDEQMQLLRDAAREGRESSLAFDTKAWAGHLETGSSMALQLGGDFILIPARATPPAR